MEFKSVSLLPNDINGLQFNKPPVTEIDPRYVTPPVMVRSFIDTGTSMNEDEHVGVNGNIKRCLFPEETNTGVFAEGVLPEEELLNIDYVEPNLHNFMKQPSAGMTHVKEQSKHEITFEKAKDQKIKQLVRLNKEINREVTRLRKRIADMKSRERFNTQLLKRADADIDRARQMVRNIDEEKSKLLKEIESTRTFAVHAERYSSEVEVLKTELNKLQLTCHNAFIAKNDEYADRVKAELNFEVLRTSIPRIFYKAIKCDAVMGPFSRLLEASNSVGRLEMLFAVTETINIPDPLPQSVMDLLDEDCIDKYEVARKELKELKVPYIEEIGGPVPPSPVSVLCMSP